MKILSKITRILLIIVLLSAVSREAFSQRVRFGLYAEPLISWFSSDTKASVNDGARPGFAYGLTFNTYFAENYAFSSGISIINASGRLNYNDTVLIRFKNSNTELLPGENVVYKIQYLGIPLGVDLKTNQIGYTTFFGNASLMPKVVIGGKGDIPAAGIEDENITRELSLFNLGYQLTLGMEYSLGGSTAIVLGLGFENNFLDITSDHPEQPVDKIRQYMIRFRLGLNF